MQQPEHRRNKDRSKVNNTNKLSMQALATKLGLTPLGGQNNQWRSLNSVNSVFIITGNSFTILNSSVFKVSTNPLDLVMIVHECSFPEAILWLNEQFGQEVAVQAADYATREMIRNTPASKFNLAQTQIS